MATRIRNIFRAHELEDEKFILLEDKQTVTESIRQTQMGGLAKSSKTPRDQIKHYI